MVDEDREPGDLLRICIKDGRIDVLRSILAELEKSANFAEITGTSKGDDGSVLHCAVAHDSVDAVRALLSSGVNPAVKDAKKQTPFETAKSDTVKSAFIQETIQAISRTDVARVKQMIDAGVDVNAVDSVHTRNTLLHYACSFGDEPTVRFLCERGANVNVANVNGETPMHDAVRRHSKPIIAVLFDHGMDLSAEGVKEIVNSKLLDEMGLSLPAVNGYADVGPVPRTPDVDTMSVTSLDGVLPAEHLRPQWCKPAHWAELLWPRPHFMRIDYSSRPMQLPSDNRLKVFVDSYSDATAGEVATVLHGFDSFLKTVYMELEVRGHKIADASMDGGQLQCGIYEDDAPKGSYVLKIDSSRIELYGNDLSGIRHGFCTLVQIIRLFRPPFSDSRRELLTASNCETSEQFGSLPCLTIHDAPDMPIRGFYLDCSGCKVYSMDTVRQFITSLSYLKMNYFFINFEVRTTDRYQLPYANHDLFRMSQLCEESLIKLVPSIDVQSNYATAEQVRRIAEDFLDDFALSNEIHFGTNVSTILLANIPLLYSLKRRLKRIFLSVEESAFTQYAKAVKQLPPFVTLCVDGGTDSTLPATTAANIVLKMSTTQNGFLCPSPGFLQRNIEEAISARDKPAVKGLMICDLSTGCEIMPPSLLMLFECACAGSAWNRSNGTHQLVSLLPAIAAEHLLLNSNLSQLLEQAAILGALEVELSKLGSPSSSSKDRLSVFVEIILNPENITLSSLTASIFKKGRIELQRTLDTLRQSQSQIPYNYNLALVFTEIQLVTELLSLICKMGQSLCFYNNNNRQRKASEVYANGNGVHSAASGVSKLPESVRVDLANKLFDIRKTFQHTWLSRNLASTLPNALKIFDNLFRALLPPSMQEYERIL